MKKSCQLAELETFGLIDWCSSNWASQALLKNGNSKWDIYIRARAKKNTYVHFLNIGISSRKDQVKYNVFHEGSVPEMRIWSILLIKSDLKWCIYLSRSLFSYFYTLCYMSENIYIGQIAKSRSISVFLFNILNTTKPNLPYVGRYIPLRFYLCNRLEDWYAQSMLLHL